MDHNKQIVQQQIEAYLRQEMTDLERSGFERRMHEDAELHEEVQQQEAMIAAIRSERMFELKSGLQGISISLWSASLMNYAKIAAISAGIGLASLGTYWVLSHEEKSSQVQQDGKSLVQTELAQRELTPDAQEKRDQIKVESAPGQSDLPDLQEPQPPGDEPAISYHKHAAASKSEPREPLFNGKQGRESEPAEPQLKSDQPQTPMDIALPEDGISKKTMPESMQPEVVIKRDNRDKFHYQFQDGKLVLYADFNEKLYEVLELNQNGQRQLYLAYDGKFYFIDRMANEISPLLEVKDKNLISILSIYQKRK